MERNQYHTAKSLKEKIMMMNGLYNDNIWEILLDKGYIGLTDSIRAINPKKGLWMGGCQRVIGIEIDECLPIES